MIQYQFFPRSQGITLEIRTAHFYSIMPTLKAVLFGYGSGVFFLDGGLSEQRANETKPRLL
jgi:hypothetical protein